MKKLMIVNLFVLVFSVPAWSLTAFLTSQYVSGMNRVCLYESVRGQHAITISASSICPITIEV